MINTERKAHLASAIVTHLTCHWAVISRSDTTAVVEFSGSTPALRRTLHANVNGEVLYQDPGQPWRSAAVLISDKP